MQALGPEQQERLTANLAAVRSRIDHAARAAGRDPAEVRLVAVTKKRPAAFVAALLDLGVAAIGENRPEEILSKQRELGRPVPWHLIGHYQRNKIAKTRHTLAMVHSVQNLELMSHLELHGLEDRDAAPLPILVQVNVSGEATKQGFEPDEVADVVDIAEAMSRIKVQGLMTMAPQDADPDQLARIFRSSRELAESIGRSRLPELSMGMSADLEAAVAEGATLVRVGTALFDGIDVGS